MPKIAEGGWLPMLVGMAILLLLTTWHRGRELVTAERVRAEGTLPDFIDEMHRKRMPTRIKGTAIFLNRSKDTTPLALRVAQTRLRAIPEEVVILTVDIGNEPSVSDEDRAELDHLGDPDDGFSHLTLRYGFQDDPDVPRGINVARDLGLVNFNPYHVTYYLSQMALVPFGDQGMAPWRKDLFMAMSRNAASLVGYFNLPAEHVVGLGGQIRFSARAGGATVATSARTRILSAGAAIELGQQRLDPGGDLVAGGADGLERLALGVGQVPVEVATAGDVGALVAAAHRHHDVGPFGVLGAEQVRTGGR